MLICIGRRSSRMKRKQGLKQRAYFLGNALTTAEIRHERAFPPAYPTDLSTGSVDESHRPVRGEEAVHV
jgi:hypothetical protein